MKSLTIRPKFVSNFQCIADKCEDHCCHNWNITIDKATHKKMINSDSLKADSKKYLKLLKQSEGAWSVIRLDADGRCPFLDEKQLCNIHKKEGAGLLSHTCRTYPRLMNHFGVNRFESLSLSCPEVVRQVFFTPDAFEFEVIDAGIETRNQPLDKWVEAVNQQSIGLLIGAGLTFEQSLLAIGLFVREVDFLGVQKLSTDIEQIAQQLLQLAKEKKLQQDWQQREKIVFGHEYFKRLRFTIFKELMILIGQENSQKTQKNRMAWLKDLNQLIADYEVQTVEMIDYCYQHRVEPLLAEHGDFWHRYVFYTLYTEHFPKQNKKPIIEQFYPLVIDVFLIKIYLAIMAANKQDFDLQDIVMGVQTYQTMRQHSKNFSETILAKLQQKIEVDLVTMLSILIPQYQASEPPMKQAKEPE